ncbi:MAG: hypothetical protein H7333_04980 [Bdellovibrionales bacterium]|nr:hypothetical protein [Oligoflexia bacterium]
MILPFRILLFIMALVTGVATSYSVFAEEVYDRLDGKGPSGKRVDVIEWEGNLEVHVYPKGSLQGMSAKLDDRVEGKKVMVVGYRLGAKGHLVRRAILGVPFHKSLKGFIDRSEKEFDKLAISNQTLSAPWTTYKFDPAPAQWYPDGDERNGESDPSQVPYLGEVKKTTPSDRAPASAAPAVASEPEVTEENTQGTTSLKTKENTSRKSKVKIREDGSLNQFNW